MRQFIFDSTGTGKTKRSLDLLNSEAHILVVATASGIPTWLKQISQWSPNSTIMLMKEYKKTLVWPADKRILITSYGMLKHITTLPDNFSMIIDEAHHCKNKWSAQSRYCQNLSKYADSVLMLTGTPTTRTVEDLLGESIVLLPFQSQRVQQLGEAWKNLTSFRKAYGSPHTIYANHQKIDVYSYSDDVSHMVREKLDAYIQPVKLSTIQLPEITWIEHDLQSAERQALTTWQETGELDDITATRASVLYGKLLQLEDGFIYTEDKQVHRYGDSKLQHIRQLVAKNWQATHRPMIVWASLRETQAQLLTTAGYINAEQYTELTRTASLPTWMRAIVANPVGMGESTDGLQKYCSTQLFASLPYTYAAYRQAVTRLARRGTLYPDQLETLVLDTPLNRSTWDVIQERGDLDRIIRRTVKTLRNTAS